MDLKKQLLKVHSKENTQLIFDYLLNHPEDFEELIRIFTQEDYRLNQRSAWVIGMVGENKGEWLLPYFPVWIDCLKNPKHNAISRNIFRSLQSIEIPEEFESAIYDLCLKDLSKTQNPTAIKVFAMTVAFNISLKHKELKEELALTIEEQIDYSSVGFASRAGKILKAIAENKLNY